MITETPKTKQQQIWRRLRRQVSLWLIVAIISVGSLVWFVGNTVTAYRTKEKVVTAQNQLRQTLDSNYYDWEKATLESYVAELAKGMNATWAGAGDVWPEVTESFAQTPVIIMSEGGASAYLLQFGQEVTKANEIIAKNNLATLPIGWHRETGLAEWPRQTVLIRVLEYGYLGSVDHQNLEWVTAALPGVLFAEMTEQNFLLNTGGKATETTVTDNLEVYDARFEVVAALQAALLENDATRRNNYLDRAAYFYNLSAQIDASASANLETLDLTVGQAAYFAQTLRVRASADLYQGNATMENFVNKIISTDLTADKLALDFTSARETAWLGFMSGLLLDRLAQSDWRGQVINSGVSPLQLLLGSRLTTETYQSNTRVERLFQTEVKPQLEEQLKIITASQSGTIYEN